VTLPPSIAAGIGRGAAALRQRSWLVIACAIAGTGLLLGAAIGYAFAHRGAAAAAASNPSDRGVAAAAEPVSPSGVRESVSAGGIAPVPNAPRGAAARRSPVRSPERTAAGRSRPATTRTPAAATPTPAATQPATSAAPAAVAAPPASTTATADSARAAARRDSIARAAALVAERDSIRREIEIRRARVDSVERLRRRIDSLPRAQLPPPPHR
jgi:hypothetical protein